MNDHQDTFILDQEAVLKPFGHIKSMVSENVAMIESMAMVDAVDEGSVLFTEDRVAIGIVLETFGPVRQPWYIVRVLPVSLPGGSEETQSNPTVGSTVMFSPCSASVKRIATDSLIKQKGSDASNLYDEEPNESVYIYYPCVCVALTCSFVLYRKSSFLMMKRKRITDKSLKSAVGNSN